MPATLSPASECAPKDPVAPLRRYRVLIVATHPVQYASPIWSGMAHHPQLDVTVAYCSLQGARAGSIDPEFGVEVQWDIPLLEGYPWVEVPNRSRRPGIGRFFGFTNPGLWRLVRHGSFDAIEIFTGYVYASFWIALLAAKIARVPALFGTDATTLDPRQGRSWKRLVKRIVWPLLFRLADEVIVPSTGGLELMNSLGIPEDRVTLTPYVVDNERWLAQSARADRAAVRASWGASAEDPVVLFCAKLQPWKRPFDLLRAFAQAAVPRARLVFAGEGPLRAPLEAEAAALGIGERTLFLGFINQSRLPAVYTAADLLVLPSAYEPFAVVVNEAMLCGCPVVASDRVGAARDLIAPGLTGFVYPCGDIPALSGLLREALSDRSRLREIGRAALQRMASWSPNENIAGQMTAIARAIHRKGARGRNSSGNASAPAIHGAGRAASRSDHA